MKLYRIITLEEAEKKFKKGHLSFQVNEKAAYSFDFFKQYGNQVISGNLCKQRLSCFLVSNYSDLDRRDFTIDILEEIQLPFLGKVANGKRPLDEAIITGTTKEDGDGQLKFQVATGGSFKRCYFTSKWPIKTFPRDVYFQIGTKYIRDTINSVRPFDKDKIIAEIPTYTGIHLITTGFDRQMFDKVCKEFGVTVDIHKNNPTALYFPNK